MFPGDLAPHILGNMGLIYAEEWDELKDKGYSFDDSIGKSGIEKACEDQLPRQIGIYKNRPRLVGKDCFELCFHRTATGKFGCFDNRQKMRKRLKIPLKI